MNIGKFSVSNPVLLNVLMVALILLGAFSALRLPREQFSEVPFFWANIIVPYPGASSEDVERSVTVPIETEMNNLKKLKKISSETREALSIVRVEFDDGISQEEFARLFQEVQSRFNKVTLPQGTLDPIIDDFSSSDFLPVIEVVLTGTIPENRLNRLALRLRDRLSKVPQVESVSLTGNRKRQFRIEIDRDRSEALGVSLSDVSRAIQGRNVTIPGGTLETVSREYLLRTGGEIRRAEDFGSLVIRQDPAGGILRLSDIGVSRDSLDPRAASTRYNGQTAIVLRVAKVVGGNSVTVVDKIKEECAAFSSELPQGTTLHFFNDSTVRIRESISVLLVNALQGLGLLVLILWAFLGWRNGLMTALGIPMTFAMTFMVLEWRGESLNSNSLFGLVLVLGMIVDHAIVIVENSYRLRSQGLSRHDAAVRGANDVLWPVISGTMTTVAAFLPLMILPGILGRFLRVIPVVVSVALVVSTLEAFLFLPLHFSEWSKDSDSKAGKWFDRIETWFGGVFKHLYTKRYLVIGAGLILVVTIFSQAGRIRQDLFQGEDYTYFTIDLTLPVGAPRTKTNEIVSRFEERLLPLVGKGEVVSVMSTIGQAIDRGQVLTQSNVAQVLVDLAERNEGRTRPIPAIVDEVKALCADIPGTDAVFFRTVRGGPPVDPPISFRLFGDNYADLSAIADRLKRELANYPDLYNISDNLAKGTPELRITVHRENAASYGLSVATIGSYIRASFDGIVASTLFENNEEIDIVVQLRRDAVNSVEQFSQLKIPTPGGRLVPFSAVCEVAEGNAIAAIKREDGKREVSITAEAWDKKNIRSINAAFASLFAQSIRPSYPGVTFTTGGEFAEFANVLVQILRLFVIGIFLIYLILGAQFKSYAQPFLILLTVPFAFVGIILFLLISGTPFSTTVLYAGVALAGVAVNDSIVLVSYINDLRQQGMATAEAISEGVRVRLRPILLTSVTTIAGLLPTALGLGGVSPVWGPMASTIIFGLIFSTLTAVIAIPCLYGVLSDLLGRKAKSHPKGALASQG